MSTLNYSADHLYYFNAEKMAKQFGTEYGCYASATRLLDKLNKELKSWHCDEDYLILIQRQQFLHHAIIADRKSTKYEGQKFIAAFKEFSDVLYEFAKLVYDLKGKDCDENAVLEKIQAFKEKFETESATADHEVKLFYDYLNEECKYVIWEYFTPKKEDWEIDLEEYYEEEPECVNYDGTVGPAVQECGLPF